MRFRVLIFLWSVASCLYIYKIHKVAKTKVSKPKRYSLLKLHLVHAFLNHLIQTRPHTSTSQCWKLCITPPKCLCKERRCNFYSCCSIVANASMSCRCYVFPKYSKGRNNSVTCLRYSANHKALNIWPIKAHLSELKIRKAEYRGATIM